MPTNKNNRRRKVVMIQGLKVKEPKLAIVIINVFPVVTTDTLYSLYRKGYDLEF